MLLACKIAKDLRLDPILLFLVQPLISMIPLVTDVLDRDVCLLEPLLQFLGLAGWYDDIPCALDDERGCAPR